MRIFSVISVFFGFSVAMPLMGQTLHNGGEPAELPPASYSQNKYVDSRGCIFLRTNSGWVPRVTRDRKLVCGFEPSLTNFEVASGRAENQPLAPAFKTLPQNLQAPTQPKVVAPVVQVPSPTINPSRPPVIQQENVVLKMGTKVQTVPNGYKLAWNDDRHNPMRGIPTAQGVIESNQVWTASVPQKIRDTAPEADKKIKPVYPFKTQEQFDIFLADAGRTNAVTVANNGQVTFKAGSQVNARVSTKSSLKGSVLYVQVGAYGQTENANRTISRLMKMGLPVQKNNRNTLTIVMAGPFEHSSAAHRALSQIRSNGYLDAYVR